MTVIPGYEVLEKISEDAGTVIYRGKSKQQQPVTIKLLKSEYPTLEEITRLRHEYKIIKELKLEGLVKAYGLEKYENGFALILEDFGGQPLSQILISRQLTISECLQIGISLAETLIDLYQVALIHKDIKPSNIIINIKTGQVKLTNFSFSSRLFLEKQTISNPNLLEGTLAYIAPEQTGRMNRSIDYRTDFYSLGVTLYEMLTGKLPFTSHEPLELVHCHIAKQPVSLCQFLQIPKAVSDIVMRLLAKNAEERYQSAAGLKFDLETCLLQLQNTGEIKDFIPGQRDPSSQLLIPQKLYGREKEVATLMNAFLRVRQGATEMMLVSGYSGIGKTSIVNEVQKPIIATRGYFITGKFDQFKRSIPYAALIQAFQELIRQLLTENQQQVAVWKKKLLLALGGNGQVLIDVIPSVELIIGSQSDVPKLGAAESENRFNRVFQQFVQVFCQAEHPLVIFLDDLQWADAASLKLIRLLITDNSSQYLFIIGAYRDNEVNLTHPLIQSLEKIRQTDTVVHSISVEPLLLTHVQQLIAETINKVHVTKQVRLLAELVYNFTQGNPFFLTQLLKSLYSEHLLVYQVSTDKWKWDIQQIQTVGITDYNIVELIARNIRKLPLDTQKVLQLAACIGNQFDLKVLATVNETSDIVTASHLWSALQTGLIVPLSSNYKIPLVLEETESEIIKISEIKIKYKFLHDKVQQAAYSLIPESLKKNTHLKIGQLLLRNTTPEEQKDKIFNLVNQLNFGANLLTKQIQKDELAKLNLIAGQKAKAATAYESAVNYLNVSLQLLHPDSWQNQYKFTFELYIEISEAEYLNANLTRALILCELALREIKNPLDRVKFYQLKIKIYLAQNQINTVLDIGQKVLSMLGISLVESPPQNLNIEQVASLSPMMNPYKLAAMEILILIHAPACFGRSAMALPILYTMVEISRQHGNSSLSIYAYAIYGAIIAWFVPDINFAYQLGQLALKKLQQLNAQEFKSKVLVATQINITHKKEHTKTTISALYEAIESGLKVGDIEFACHAANFYCSHLFFVGTNLELVTQNQAIYIEFISKLEQQHPLYLTKICAQTVANLLNQSVVQTKLIGEILNEEEVLPYFFSINNLISLFDIYFYKLFLCYTFEEYQNSLIHAKKALSYAGFIQSEIIFILHNWFYSLALLAEYSNNLLQSENNQLQINELKDYLRQVDENQEKMKYWAEYAPMNYKHKYELVEAEKARVLGQTLRAMEYYDSAIAGAQQNEYIQEEALAYELAAKFYLALGRHEIARTYMTKAHYAYICWGAIAKAKDLDSKYSHIIIFPQKDSQLTKSNSSNYSNTISNLQVLDAATIFKAYQTITSEIILDQLLKKLMNIVIENAGAQTGFLILKQQEQLFVAAKGTVDSPEVVLCQSKLTGNSKQLPNSLINYVVKTREDVILTDATDEGIFTKDVYIIQNKPKSVLCTPIIYQGELIGVLYLENNLAVDAFTSERFELMRILSSQAAISIKNAQLYENLNQEISERQQAEAERIKFTKKLALKNKALRKAKYELAKSNRNLEEKVQERTKELSKTLEILKATQDELIKANQELQSLYRLDKLTQIANRHYFDEYLLQEWNNLQLSQRPLSLILCDVDYFKKYNDFYGHQCGDYCLQQIAKTLLSAARRSVDLVARYGGEEFTVILPSTDLEGAIVVAERIQQAVRQSKLPHACSDVSEFITVSLGIACVVPTSTASPAYLITAADKALYEAKRLGRNCYVTYET